VYVLESAGGRVYVGCTCDTARRLRQHNGEIKGGARATRGRGPWQFGAFITGFGADRLEALRAEWRVKREVRRRWRAKGSGASRALRALAAFARTDATEWTDKSGPLRGGGLTVRYRVEHGLAAAEAAAALGCRLEVMSS
jgi:predicted GIY-YIG superfamily endonuclease